MNRKIIRHGFVLILLALITGFLIPTTEIPRLGLSAHTIGILSGALLIAIGAVWPLFNLGSGQSASMYWCWVYSSYANWLGCLVGAFTGAGRMTPISSAGREAGDAAEIVVAVLLVSVAITALVGASLAIWGLCEVPRKDA